MEFASHYDLVVIVTTSFALQIAGLVFLAVYLGRQVADAPRPTRAVGAPLIQKADKTRAILRERP